MSLLSSPLGCCRNPARFRTSGKIRGCARSTLCPRSATTPDSTARASAHRFGFACTDSRLGRPPPDPLLRPDLPPGPAAAGHTQPPWEHPVGPVPPLSHAPGSAPSGLLSAPSAPSHCFTTIRFRTTCLRTTRHRSRPPLSPRPRPVNSSPLNRSSVPCSVTDCSTSNSFCMNTEAWTGIRLLAARLRPAGDSPVTLLVASPVPRRSPRWPTPRLPAAARRSA